MTKLKPKKRSLTLNGHRTSVSIEDRFWTAFSVIAKQRNMGINELAAEIDTMRDPFDGGLASAMRDYVLNWYMSQVDAGPHHD
jgi:predicted DNA-binding ribbon-helix-helix protein